MDGVPRPAEDHGDYRLFRWLAANGARLVVACLVLVAWNLLFFRDRTTLIFLGSSAFLALGVSLLAALVAYTLFKRRGGKVEKSLPPVGP